MATRGSALAIAQSGTVAAQITALTGRPVETVRITTQGDTNVSVPIERLGTDGVFVVGVRQALLNGDADFAVHSLKDLPTSAFPGVRLAATPTRNEPGDALVARHDMTLDMLPAGARVGTGSNRRMGMLRAMRPDLDVVAIRGNVDTRLRHVVEGRLDAVVLAAAGLCRLDLLAQATQMLDPTTFVPAPGQGALAVECREDEIDEGLLAALRELDDPATRAATTAERAILNALQAGCNAPVGAYAVCSEPGFWEPELHLRAVVVDPAGAVVLSESASGPVAGADELGRLVASHLSAAGASALLGESVA
jgi:hydroxymethylbilane synthase